MRAELSAGITCRTIFAYVGGATSVGILLLIVQWSVRHNPQNQKSDLTSTSNPGLLDAILRAFLACQQL